MVAIRWRYMFHATFYLKIYLQLKWCEACCVCVCACPGLCHCQQEIGLLTPISPHIHCSNTVDLIQRRQFFSSFLGRLVHESWSYFYSLQTKPQIVSYVGFHDIFLVFGAINWWLWKETQEESVNPAVICDRSYFRLRNFSGNFQEL